MDLITVRTFQNFISAHIALTKLRSEGIECYLKDENLNTLLPNVFGGIKLMVKNDDVSKVIGLLNQFDEDYRSNAVCPKCGSHNIELVSKPNVKNMFSAILSWLFFANIGSTENIYRCSNCGYESNTLPETVNANTDFSSTESNN